LALAITGSAATASSAICPDVAEVAGDERLVSELGALLTARGLELHAPEGCPRVVVLVEPSTRGVDATIVDRAGRLARRSASDLRTLAAIVDSWAREDLGATLLVGHAPPPTPVERVTAEAPPPEPSTWHVGAAGVVLGASDASVWVGGELGAGVDAGPVRLGVLARLQADTGGADGESPGKDADRFGLDVLVTAELPIALGAFTLRPALGAGVGWADNNYTREGIAIDTGGFRVEARLGLSAPLGGRVAMTIDAVFVASPFGHTTTLSEAAVDAGYEIIVAGQPTWALGASLGFRFGGS